jgi:5-deoxy-glucuronate isomerase
MMSIDTVAHSRKLSDSSAGELLRFSRQEAGWEWMGLEATRLNPGQTWNCHHSGEETVFVLLSGRCSVDWGAGVQNIGQRTSVFDGLPYAIYLRPGAQVQFTAASVCEIAACHVPAEGKFPSRLITPKDVQVSLRGGGNASRQIVDVMRPDFPAERLIVVEVYTPGGNWSSYPPHKHDVHRPPAEVDLDEIYYYRMNKPGAFAHQRLYTPDGKRDTMVTVHDGDAVLVRDGYHPVVAGPGYDIYYLNFIAGSARSLAVTEDPNHVWIRDSWKEMDTRLPLVKPADSVSP